MTNETSKTIKKSLLNECYNGCHDNICDELVENDFVCDESMENDFFCDESVENDDAANILRRLQEAAERYHQEHAPHKANRSRYPCKK